MSSTEPGDGTPVVDHPTPYGVVGPDDLPAKAGGSRPGDTADDLADEPEDEPEDEDGLFPAPVTPAPRTGDAALDDALSRLEDAARSGDPEAQVAAGERVHRELQQRLTHLEGPGAG